MILMILYFLVQSIDNYDITGDGVKDLIVGKHDGNIEIYAYEDGEDTEPLLKYTYVRFRYNFYCSSETNGYKKYIHVPWMHVCTDGFNFFTLQNCGESVSSVEGGVVGSSGFDEVIASTYTGNVAK